MSDHKETTRRQEQDNPPVVEGKPEPTQPGFKRVERQAQVTSMKTITAPAAQEAPAASFEVTITTTDALGKTLMSSTPNVKLINGTAKIDLYEVNPVHLVPGQFRVNLQQALVKTIAKDEALTFEY